MSKKGGLFGFFKKDEPEFSEEEKFQRDYALQKEKEEKSDAKNIVKSYWPRAGRVVLFDGRIPHVARSVETDKFRVSLVFKGTTDDMKPKEVDPKDSK